MEKVIQNSKEKQTTEVATHISGVGKAFKTVSSQSFLYLGNPKGTSVHTKNLDNSMWVKKTMEMTFDEKNFFTAENLAPEEIINRMITTDFKYKNT